MTFSDKVRLLMESGVFDANWYIDRYPDVARSAMSPAEHFVRIGQHIGRKANKGQDTAAASRLLAARHAGVPTDVPLGDRQAAPLDAPMPQPRRAAAAQDPRGSNTGGRSPNAKAPPLPRSYTQYSERIFAKIESLSGRMPLPVDVEIDTDYTGPTHGTPFDSFFSQRQRDDSAKQIVRMLQFGITARNPRPGVHAARDENGKLIRYPSIASLDSVVHRIPSDMLIHIHAFYPDIVAEMLDCFVGEAKHGRFLITTTTRKNHDAVRKILEERDFTQHHTMLIENKGRDTGPFLDYAIDHAADRDVICHVHTKKSPEITAGYGEKWRKSLYDALLTQTAVDAFEDTRLGLLFPETSRSVGWGKNRKYCEEIALRFDRKLSAHPGPIPVGNMFFARVEVARAMRDATRGMEWPREPVPYDGSVLHAIERMWPLACESAGFEWSAIYNQSGDLTKKGI